MSQENQTMNTDAVENLPVKRKRGRPRKNENLIRGDRASATPISDAVKRNRQRKIDPKSGTGDPMVGQVVSGVLDGSFDAGYLLTVRVSNSNRVLRGVVFEPRLSVPVSGANDVAPQVPMLKRNEIPLKKPAPVHCSSDQREQKSKSPVKLHPTNGVSVPTKASSHIKHVPQVATQELPSQMQTDLPLSSKEASNGVNHAPQAVPQAFPQVEIRIENQVVQSQATEARLPPVTAKPQPVTAQLIPELSQMLQENQTTLNSDTPLDIQTKFPAETPRIDETSRLNERPSKVMRVTEKDAKSQPKTNQPVQILEIDMPVSEQSRLSKAASEPQVSNTNVQSKNADLVPRNGFFPLQSQNDLFGDTGYIE